MPYKVEQRDGHHVVVNTETGAVVPGGDHGKDKGKANAHMRALYANVKDAGDGTFEVVDWFTGATLATLGDENAARTVHDLMVESGEIYDYEFGPEQLAELGKKGKAFRNARGGWSYPTPSAGYVRKAMKAFGRSIPADRPRLKAYLVRRARAEGLPEAEVTRISGYAAA